MQQILTTTNTFMKTNYEDNSSADIIYQKQDKNSIDKITSMVGDGTIHVYKFQIYQQTKEFN